MTRELTATITLDLAVRVTGTFQAGRPARGPSYASGGEPAEPDSVEDLDVEDILFETVKWEDNRRIVVAKSILTGIDRTSGVYRQLVANILNVVGEQACEALLEEVSE